MIHCAGLFKVIQLLQGGEMDRESLNHRTSVKAMAERGMSQRDIAAALGISQPSVSRLIKMTEVEAGNPIAVLNARLRAKDAQIEQPNAADATFEW